MKYRYQITAWRDFEEVFCTKCNVTLDYVIENKKDELNGMEFYNTSLGIHCEKCIDIEEVDNPDFAIGLGAINEQTD